MAYNKENFIRIREEYSKKYLKAREAADARSQELYTKIPELRAIDSVLASTASRIMGAVCSNDTEQKIAAVRKENEEILAAKHGYAVRFAKTAARFRKELIERYGEEKGSKIRYAEAYELCPYGTQPDEKFVKELLSF